MVSKTAFASSFQQDILSVAGKANFARVILGSVQMQQPGLPVL